MRFTDQKTRLKELQPCLFPSALSREETLSAENPLEAVTIKLLPWSMFKNLV
jgi:hypothetical protein